MYDVVDSKSIKVARTSKGFDRCDEMLLSVREDEGDDSDDVGRDAENCTSRSEKRCARR